jgi:hypothetical protein
MPAETALASGDFRWLTTLASITDEARSLDDIVRWLRAQPFVASIKAADYLLKSNPPQREISIEIRLISGGCWKGILKILELGPARFRLGSVREPL